MVPIGQEHMDHRGKVLAHLDTKLKKLRKVPSPHHTKQALLGMVQQRRMVVADSLMVHGNRHFLLYVKKHVCTQHYVNYHVESVPHFNRKHKAIQQKMALKQKMC